MNQNTDPTNTHSSNTPPSGNDSSKAFVTVVLPIVIINLLALGFVYVSLNTSMDHNFESLSLRVEDKLAQLSSESLQRATQNGFSQGQQFALEDLVQKSNRPDCPTVAVGSEGNQAVLLNVNNAKCYQTIVNLAQQIIQQGQQQKK